MLIGELARQTGLSRDTIRYYERLGLLRPCGRPGQGNNYKDYPPAAVTRLGLIQQGKNLGFSLNEIIEGLDLLTDTGLSDTEAAARIAEKLAVIEAKMRDLDAMRNSLLYFQRQIVAGRCSLQVPLAERPATPPDLTALFGRRPEAVSS
ncbi:MAG: MerR family transcriptional regulator [Janthinobacterium lividum]